MDCEQLDRIVMDILYGEADPQQAADAKRHVEQCERCAGMLSELRAARRDAVIPLLDAPLDFEPYLLDASHRFHKDIPWPRRVGRWISWAGAYAMRPQLAMGALLFLMIGSSLFLMRGRHRGDQVDVVRVTEQGVPERDGPDPSPSQEPALLMPPEPELTHRAKENPPKLVPHADSNSVGSEDTRRKHDAGSVEVSIDAGQIALPVDDPGGTSSQAALPHGEASGDAGGDRAASGLVAAMDLFKAGSYASAFRAFDSIANAGGPSAATAALYAAKSVRASAGCAHALPRFESVAARFPSSSAGLEARWDTVACARITGDITRARIILRDLARVESQRKRAEEELARISIGSTPTTPTASSASPGNSSTPPASSAEQQPSTPASNP